MKENIKGAKKHKLRRREEKQKLCKNIVIRWKRRGGKKVGVRNKERNNLVSVYPDLSFSRRDVRG